MKWKLTVVVLLYAALSGHAQPIQTIAPRQPVIEGSAFQVQYIVSTPEDLVNIIAPETDSIRIVSGPHHHRTTLTSADGLHSIDNITYTLVALKSGKLKIGGLTAVFNQERIEKSPDVTIQVIPPEKASFTSRSAFTDVSLYAPPVQSDLQKLIHDNIFIKTDVSRKSCFTGEPVVVTFTLYSRLQSTSEVVNSPSLYGFGVSDLLNINEAHISVSTINGKIFNTSILRQLALYPETSGSLTIDPMQLKSDIEFDDSSDGNNKIHREVELASPEVNISVKPLPGKRPESFSGGVGNFSINAFLSDTVIEQGKQVHLVVKIQGRGNFFQISAPTITWPPSFEAFDPETTDRIAKNTVPAEGVRTYLYHFIAEQSGNYQIPPIDFSYFDPSAARYFTLHTKPLSLKIISSGKTVPPIVEDVKQKHSFPWLWIILAIAFISVFFIFLPKKKKQAIMASQPVKKDLLLQLDTIDISQVTVQQLCTRIQKILAEAVKQYPELENKWSDEMQLIRNDCQLHAYSSASSESDKENLKQRVTILLKKVV